MTKRLKQAFSWLFSDIDFKLFLIVMLLSLIGVIFSYSSQILIREEKINLYFKFIKQIIYLVLGLFIMLGCAKINYKKIAEHSFLLMLICVGLLAFTLVAGVSVNNSKRWINFGFLSIQPSEFVKLVIIIFTANYLVKLKENFSIGAHLIFVLGINLIPIGLILIQPDLGTASISFFIVFFMLAFSMVDRKYFIALFYFVFTIGTVLFLLIYFDVHKNDQTQVALLFYNNYFIFFSLGLLFLATFLTIVNLLFWRNMVVYYLIAFLFITFSGTFIAFLLDEFFLKSYQKERLFVFINPEIFRWTLGYNIIQSKITIGSGGLLGKGLFNGTQSQLGFLPSRSTDFIFSVIAEELGFVGSLLVVLLFFLLIWRLIFLATKVKDYLGGLIIIGVTSFFALQSLVNIGMTMSLLPITGLPLPFISAGGSTLLSSLMAIGLVLSVYRSRSVN